MTGGGASWAASCMEARPAQTSDKTRMEPSILRLRQNVAHAHMRVSRLVSTSFCRALSSNNMRITALVWLLCVPLGASYGQSARSAIFLFGPAGAEAARQAARTAAAVSRHWLSQPRSAAELRRSGSVDALPLDAKAPAKSIEPAFLNAAREARDTDPGTFL